MSNIVKLTLKYPSPLVEKVWVNLDRICHMTRKLVSSKEQDQGFETHIDTDSAMGTLSS